MFACCSADAVDTNSTKPPPQSKTTTTTWEKTAKSNAAPVDPAKTKTNGKETTPKKVDCTKVVTDKVLQVYPGALSNIDLAMNVKAALSSHGYGETTLLATSLCCDEVNRELDKEFRKLYGDNFSMGGLAGFASGGVTSFGAMAHHIPKNGSCLIVYGPHVGIDSKGVVGKVNRRGRDGSGACCGSAAAAAEYVKKVSNGKIKKAAIPDDIEDAQQMWVGEALLPYADRLAKANDPAAELPLALFDGEDKLMKSIVTAGCQEVAGEGLIALLGGIQINTPEGVPDYFLPKVFEVRNNKNELVSCLIHALDANAPKSDVSKVTERVHKSYPGAISNGCLTKKVAETLASQGYGESTLLATALCCDEVNRVLEKDFRKIYGDNFSMGGLAGFASGGVTSFGAMAHHIPKNGSCLIVYGPHVGIDSEGVVGKVNRRGRDGSGACCGSAAAAAGYVKKVSSGEVSKADVPDDIVDAQQMWVGEALLSHADRLQKADDPDVELPLALFDCQDQLIQNIVSAGCQEVAGEGLIALLGGVQINTPEGITDYFLPKVFELRNNRNELVKNLVNFINPYALPSPIAKVTTKIQASFPGASSNLSLVSKVKNALASCGFGENTLLASSLCCDEVNRELEKEFRKSYGDNFSMGGLAGFPFGGVTSFGAMAHHIPKDGSCLIVYGPHVGVDANGTVGKVNRRGRDGSGACCGSATAAAGYVDMVRKGEEKKAGIPDDIDDAQQMWVGDALLPYADRLKLAEDRGTRGVELPKALFDAQDDMMKTIVAAGCQEVAGDGLIALLGGIQINTPAGMPDYFLPKTFELRNNKNELVASLIHAVDDNAPVPAIVTVTETIKSSYPGALSNIDLAAKVKHSLNAHGYGESSLLATSLCCDEVNRDLEKELRKSYGPNFSMGGLAGFPFGGVTSFGAMAHHIAKEGSCLVVYGPHVGIDADGTVGKVNRRGREQSGACCGSATAASGYVSKVKNGVIAKSQIPDDLDDAQQMWVGDMLLPYAERLEKSSNPSAELPLCLFDAQDEMMKSIVAAGCQEVAGDGLIALLGGIQINTPPGMSDYFLPKIFELRNNKNEFVASLINAVDETAPIPAIAKVTEKIQLTYPGALSNKALTMKVNEELSLNGYGETSLIATSLCCDEVNRELEKEFRKSYGPNFSMGGLAGFAFGGITSFGAMAHHIPDNGSCLIVYGPHVGIDADGIVGKVNRRGREHSGACCGSATAAAGYVNIVSKGEEKKAVVPDDIDDAQQMFVGDLLLPYADRLKKAADPSAELPLCLFDAQDNLMKDIVAAGCKEVAGDGLIALLGGIQINTPPGMSDYFLPKVFELRTNNNFVKGMIHKINDSPTEPAKMVTFSKTVTQHYPGALKNADLAEKVKAALGNHGYGETTLLATSLCCDEVNRELEKEFRILYGDNFNMGGLAGFSFGGVTSFGAMAHHIPSGGSCLIIYGPHVGIDANGTVGKVNRRGRDGSGACCGSATAAASYVLQNANSDVAFEAPDDIVDAQQKWVGEMLLPYSDRLVNADAAVELPLALFDCQDEYMKEIVSAGCGEVAGNGLIALLGGIQINTPEGESDYFLPKVFELRNNKNRKIKSLIHTLR